MMPLPPGYLRYHQWCQPPLAAGRYTLEVQQDAGQLNVHPTGSLPFSVAGPRFSLNPSDIYCVYPPRGQMADFSHTLPHVVFTRRTLPWERAVEPDKSPSAEMPWMALLLFRGDEIPKLKNKLLKVDANPPEDCLLHPQDSGVLAPRIPAGEIDDYERKATCTTIDVPLDLFRRVAPTAADLKYLAHVREVKTDDKETLSFLADGWFSVTIGNRFPEPQKSAGPGSQTFAMENQVFLVSLEGVLPYLPEAKPVIAGTAVRLAVLASWNFQCTEAFSFKKWMDELNAGELRLEPAGNTEPETPEAYVADAFDRGYAPLNQHTRLGERTVSWYRGPLSAVLAEKREYGFEAVPDSLLRYDRGSGMMDVTYAAAFQLGRLLGLQDRPFARALTTWREDLGLEIRDFFRRQKLYGEIRPMAAPDAIDPKQSLIDVFAASLADPDKPAQPSRKPAADPDFSSRLPPESVRQWLARLILLYRVPFHYLVPNPLMLPENSMRFFTLDPGWINCLLAGACSVGRDRADESSVDEILRKRFLEFGLDSAPQVRRRPSSPFASAEPDPPPNQPAAAAWPMDGFLMRSALVGGWQGLEMRAWKNWTGNPKEIYGPDALRGIDPPVAPLRIDRLSPNVMICMFNGPVGLIEVREPPEGLHFGARVNGYDYTKAGFRYLDDSGQHTAGSQIPGNPQITVPLRASPADRVVDFKNLADRIQQKIGVAIPTSAEMAVEMTESPGRVFIRRQDGGKP